MLPRPSSARVVLRGAFLRRSFLQTRGVASGLLPTLASTSSSATRASAPFAPASPTGFASLAARSRPLAASSSVAAAHVATACAPLPLAARVSASSTRARAAPRAASVPARGLTSSSAKAAAASLFRGRLALSPRSLSLLLPSQIPSQLAPGPATASHMLKALLARQVYTSSSLHGMLMLLVLATVALSACQISLADDDLPEGRPQRPGFENPRDYDWLYPDNRRRNIALPPYETGSPAPPAREAQSDIAKAARAEAKRRGALEEDRFNRLVRTNRARQDPFGATYDPNPMTPYEWAKLLFNYTLFPIGWVRAGLVTALFATGCLLAKLSIAGLDIGPHNNNGMSVPPQREGWRAAAKGAIPLVIRAALFVAGFHSLDIKGEKADPLDAPVIVSNHVSLLDAVILFMLYDGPSFISKASIDQVPVLNWPLRACGAILVDRSSPTSRADCAFEIRRRAAVNAEAAAIRATTGVTPPCYPPLLVFPEGTTTTGDTLVAFKSGAFKPLVPVQPVVLRYPHRFFNPTDAGAGKGNPWFVPRLLGQFENKAEVTFLPVMRPKARENAREFANRVQSTMADALQVQPCAMLAY